VVDDLPASEDAPFEILRAEVASTGSLIHHDPHATARALLKLVRSSAALRRTA
jgi:hypothetical protein